MSFSRKILDLIKAGGERDKIIFRTDDVFRIKLTPSDPF